MIRILTGSVREVKTQPGSYPVSPARQEKVLRYRFEADKKRSLGAELLLQAGLRELVPGFVPPAQFETAAGGKPGLSWYRREDGRRTEFPRPLFFNLSHSGEWAACVLSDKPVGIDLERERPGRGSLAAGRFHPLEREAIQGCEVSEEAFLCCWVLKESYLKAVGCGLREKLDRFCVWPWAAGRPERDEAAMTCSKEGGCSERAEAQIAHLREGGCSKRAGISKERRSDTDRFALWRDEERQPYELRLLQAPAGYRMAVCRLGGFEEETIRVTEIRLE